MREIENSIEQRARRMAFEAATTSLRSGRIRPPDAGAVGMLMSGVQRACAVTRSDLVLEVAEAWELYIIDNDELDGFVQFMSDLMPAEWWAERATLREARG